MACACVGCARSSGGECAGGRGSAPPRSGSKNSHSDPTPPASSTRASRGRRRSNSRPAIASSSGPVGGRIIFLSRVLTYCNINITFGTPLQTRGVEQTLRIGAGGGLRCLVAEALHQPVEHALLLRAAPLRLSVGYLRVKHHHRIAWDEAPREFAFEFGGEPLALREQR